MWCKVYNHKSSWGSRSQSSSIQNARWNYILPITNNQLLRPLGFVTTHGLENPNLHPYPWWVQVHTVPVWHRYDMKPTMYQWYPWVLNPPPPDNLTKATSMSIDMHCAWCKVMGGRVVGFEAAASPLCASPNHIPQDHGCDSRILHKHVSGHSW